MEIIQNFEEKEDYQREDPDKLTCLMFMSFIFFGYLFNLFQKTEIREQIKRAWAFSAEPEAPSIYSKNLKRVAPESGQTLLCSNLPIYLSFLPKLQFDPLYWPQF